MTLASENASSLTTADSIPADSTFTLTLYTVAADGWSKTVLEGVKTAKDATPPIRPAVVAGSAGEEELTLVYTKGENADDTVKLTVSCDKEGAVLKGTVDETTDTIDVSGLAGGESLTSKTFSGWRVLGVDYTDASCSDGNYYTFYDTWNRDSVQIGGENRGYAEYNFSYYEVSKETDELAGAPDPVTEASYSGESLTATSVILTWTNPTAADFDHVEISYGDEMLTASGNSLEVTGLSSNTSYSFAITAVDMEGNASSAVTVTLTTKGGSDLPVDIAVEPGYSGQLLVTWTDANKNDSYTYTVTASADGEETVEKADIAQGTQKALLSGLTVGKEYTVVVKADENAAAAVTGTPKTVIWQLKNQFNSAYWSEAVTSDGSYITHVANSSSQPYQYWIVRPALDGTADASFEASDVSGTPTGLFWYFDLSGTRLAEAKGSGSTKRGFVSALNYSDGSPVSVKNGAKEAQPLSAASFYVEKSTSTATVFDGYSAFHWLKVVDGASTYCVDNDWYVDSLVAFSSQTGNQYNWAYKVAATTDADYTKDLPGAVTALSVGEVTDSSITLSWTKPADVDFGYVVISADGLEPVTASGESATVTGLTADTSYSFTVTSYDLYGNACQSPATVTGSTSSLIAYPTSVAASVYATGAIKVTWTDIAATGYTYTVSADNGVEAQSGIAEGLQSASFTGLTVGTEYTFTVTAVKDETDYTDESAKASCTARQVVHVVNGGGNYLQSTGAGKSCFWTELNADYENKWILMPALSDGTDSAKFSLASFASQESDLYLVIDDENTYTKDSAGSPVGGMDSNCNNHLLFLKEKPTTAEGFAKASFTITEPVNCTDIDNAAYSSATWVSDTAYYLREWWGQAIVHKTTDSGTANGKYSVFKFVEVTE